MFASTTTLIDSGSRVRFPPSPPIFCLPTFYKWNCCFFISTVSILHWKNIAKLSFTSYKSKGIFTMFLHHIRKYRKHYGIIMSVRPSVHMSVLFNHWSGLDQICGDVSLRFGEPAVLSWSQNTLSSASYFLPTKSLFHGLVRKSAWWTPVPCCTPQFIFLFYN